MRALLRRLRRAGERFLQALGRGLFWSMLALRRREWREEEMGQPAIVFAPHEDDEVLGCGGTILRKRRAGAAVTVVFMTDGSASHPQLMAADEMKRLRVEEAVAACGVLGVARADVVFLNFKDGALGQHLDEAVRQVSGLLGRIPCREVFIPHTHDGPPDHLATTQAVLAALRTHPAPVTVYEYVVWLWCNWPWTGLPGKLREIIATLRSGVAANWRLVQDCRCFVRIGDVVDLKRAALNEHKSQVTRLVPDPRWSVLADVFSGEFLACFFRDREIFYRHDGPPRA